VGYFDCEHQAVKAYDEAILVRAGEFACLNDLPEWSQSSGDTDSAEVKNPTNHKDSWGFLKLGIKDLNLD